MIKAGGQGVAGSNPVVPTEVQAVSHHEMPSCFAVLRDAARSAGRSDAPGMARSVILEGEGESIDGVCTTLVRVIRRCFPAPPYRARCPPSWPCSGGVLPHRHSLLSSACLLV